MPNNSINIETIRLLQLLKIGVVIPTYNNAHTIVGVIRSVLEYSTDVIVVNDGSTDDTLSLLQSLSNSITLITYPANHGKGFAIKKGMDEAKRKKWNYVITIDSDGQHFASDISNFALAIQHHPNALIVGSRSFDNPNMPHKNRFANRFSNFWFVLQTGIRIPDTQSGYRLYPINSMGNMKLLFNRYETELELLVRSAWRGVPIVAISIQVYYPPENERITHFNPNKDFLRISLLNTLLCFGALFYGFPFRLFRTLFSH